MEEEKIEYEKPELMKLVDEKALGYCGLGNSDTESCSTGTSGDD